MFEVSVVNKTTYIGYEVVRNLVTEQLTPADFDKLRNYQLAAGLYLLRTKSQMTTGTGAANDERRYHVYDNMEIRYGNDIYYACRDWRESQVSQFVEFLRMNFPQISIKKVY